MLSRGYFSRYAAMTATPIAQIAANRKTTAVGGE
jgi:hypothetical protein